MQAQRRKDGKAFHCPSGHAMVYTPGKTEVEKLKEQVEAMQRRIDALNSNLDHERSKFRCCVAGCDFWRNTKSSLRKHLDRDHQIREDVKRLPADAGKSASNSDVGAL